ncbi:hypothetical protein [Mesorhizobium sp.]|uniref:hypothetical protein n=1 Tax=Mesorhizobium sp. TaxID=1871066 RepID=UPI00257CB33B|nr:hypothetical protein [Mesorhizobium sp.]
MAKAARNAAKVSGGTSSNSYRLPLATNHTERILLSGSYAIFRIEVDGMIWLDQKPSTIGEPVTFLRGVAPGAAHEDLLWAT